MGRLPSDSGSRATHRHTMTEQTDATEIETADERYGAIETGDGDTIIYDRKSPDAWVQSNLVVRLDA